MLLKIVTTDNLTAKCFNAETGEEFTGSFEFVPTRLVSVVKGPQGFATEVVREGFFRSLNGVAIH